MNDFDSTDICFPISDIIELLNWKCNDKCWIHKHDVVDIRERTNYLISGSVLDTRNKSDVFSEFKWASNFLPKTIFCHDYKGGYIEDRFCNGSPNVDTYRFFNWAAIDIFIYFSHKLVTIPTQGWLNAGHTHGVPVLGTVITEWKDGEKIWRTILTDNNKINRFAIKLSEVCAHFKFDGYLLNVENKISEHLVPRLIQFVALLKTNLDLYCGRRTWLIWYDSVTTKGDLDWQNKLCPLNKPFFDMCDGIFLNYVWKPSDLLESITLASSRKFDVYVGVDVYGRNCYQDGGFSVDKAMAVLRSQNMSVALFAPGWTYEKKPSGEEFIQREISFWKKFSPYLYIHGPSKLPFSTNFCQGISFDKTSGEPLFNLGMQQYQPTAQACCTDCCDKNCISLCLDDGVLYNGACLCVAAISVSHSKLFHRLFVCDFGGSVEKPITVQVTLSLKNHCSDPASRFRIYFVIEDKVSVEGKKGVNMKTKPKGYRASVQAGQILVTGSLIDFTAEKQSKETKISVLKNDEVSIINLSTWQDVKFLIELKAEQCLTEILLLPAIEGSVLWGLLQMEELNYYEEKSNDTDFEISSSSSFEKCPQIVHVASSL